MPKVLSFWPVIVLAVVLQACATEGDRSAPQMSRYEALDAMRLAIQGDYDPYASPARQRDDVPIAVEGEIQRVYAGAVDAGPEMIEVALIDVAVSNIWKGGKSVTEVTILFPWAQGGPTSVEELASGLENGTRVAAFGQPTGWPLPGEAPSESIVMETSAEGLLVQTEGDSFEVVYGDEPSGPGWRGIDTFSELRESLTDPTND